VTFTWSAGAGVQYWLNVSSTLGGVDLYSASQGTALARTVSALPTDGRPIYVRLWTLFGNGAWVSADYTFTAATVVAQPTALSSPTDPEATLPRTSVALLLEAEIRVQRRQVGNADDRHARLGEDSVRHHVRTPRPRAASPRHPGAAPDVSGVPRK